MSTHEPVSSYLDMINPLHDLSAGSTVASVVQAPMAPVAVEDDGTPNATNAPPMPIEFAAPHLGLVVAGVQRLSMRPADELSSRSLTPGSLCVGFQPGAPPTRQILRVVNIQFFTSPALAYEHYRTVNLHGELLPPGWCQVDGNPVRAADGADVYCMRAFGYDRDGWMRPGVQGVRVLTLSPVRSTPLMRAMASDARVPAPQARAEQPPAPRLTHVHPKAPRASSVRVPCAYVTNRAVRAPPPAFAKHASDPMCQPYLPLSPATVSAVTSAEADMEPALLERVLSDARRRARTRGATAVTARDFASAAAKAAGMADPHESPAEDVPIHYDEVVDALQQLRRTAHTQLGGG